MSSIVGDIYKSVRSWIVGIHRPGGQIEKKSLPPLELLRAQLHYPIGDPLLRCTNWTNVQKKKKRLEEIGRQPGASGFRIKTS